MENIIQERKEKIMSFFKNNQKILVYAALIIIIALGAGIRSQNIEILKDQTTGKYISAELDSTLWLRYAKYIAEHGSLPDVDYMRFYPVGADLNVIGTFISYFVAYLYKFLHVFSPDITVEYADIIHPIIAMAVMSLFMFLFVRRIFDDKIALLSVLFINIIPTFIFRSTAGSSDHDILGMMFFMITFYLYIVAWQSKTLRSTLFFGVLAAISTVLGRHTAGNLNFAFFVFGAFALVSIFFNRFEKKDFYLYATWLGLTMVIIEIAGKFGGILAFATSVTTGVAFIALIVAATDFFFFKLDLFKIKSKIEQKMPLGLASLLISIVIGSIIVAVVFGPEFFITKGRHVGQYLFRAYAETRWTLTVAENRKPFVTDWFDQMFRPFVYFFLFGAVWLFHDTVRKIRGAWKLTAIFAVFLVGYIFSRYASNSTFNGQTGISHLLFYGSIVGFFALIAYLYLRTFYKDKELYSHISEIDIKHSFIFVWFFIMVAAATSAIRLLFEFSVVTSIIAAFFIVSAFGYIWSLKLKPVKYALFAVLLIILISPLSLGFIQKGFVLRQYESSKGQAASIGPSYNLQWQYAGRWARESTPKDAVFIHWWDYGYWVQEGFERTTVTDGGNFFIYWNYLVGRYILTGDNPKDALELMKTHNVTHLLIISDEIGKYGAYASIGSDLNYDRFASLGIFTNDPRRTQETRNETVYVYSGGIALYEEYAYKDVVFPSSTPVGGFLVYMSNVSVDQGKNTMNAQISRVEAAMFKDGQQHNIPISCVYLDKGYTFDIPDAMPACLRIIPQFQGNSLLPLGNAIFLQPKVMRTLFGQMYILEREWPGFKLVYNDAASTPLAIYQGRIIGPMKIWEINYPPGIKPKPEYLELDYPDPRLKLPAG